MVMSTKWKLISEASITVIGIFIFAYFISAPFPTFLVAVLGLVISGFQILRRILTSDGLKLFGIEFYRSTWIYSIIGIQLGILIGMFYRWHLSIKLVPETLTFFALIAAAIGTSEELFFRGYLQQQLNKINTWLAIPIASVAHTVYKALIFLSPFAVQHVKVSFLIIWTFAVGLLLGGITKASKSVIPAVFGHALFDIWVYGQLSHAPWWVW